MIRREVCRDCGAPRVRRAGTSSIRHVQGCHPGARWEVSRRMDGGEPTWTPIPPQDAALYRDTPGVRVRLAEVAR